MSYIKSYEAFKESIKHQNVKISFGELYYLIEEIQNDYRLNEANLFKSWSDKIKGFFNNFGNFFSDGQKDVLKKILPKKKFSLTPEQLKWVYDYVVKSEGEFTINNFLKVFSKLLKEKNQKKLVKEVVGLPGEFATVATKLPAKLPPLPPAPKIPNLITAITPESGDVSDVVKDVGDIGISHPEYILFAAVLGLLAFGGFKLFDFFKNKDKKINLSDLQMKTPNPPDERPEPIRDQKKPNPPDERPEPIREPKKPNPPDERLEPIASSDVDKLKKRFEKVITSLVTYRPNKNEPTGSWWYSDEGEMLDNGNWGWKAYPPTQKPDWVTEERWIEMLEEFQKGGEVMPKELAEKGFKFLTIEDRSEIRNDPEKNKMLYENPASTYKAPGLEPQFLK